MATIFTKKVSNTNTHRIKYRSNKFLNKRNSPDLHKIHTV